MIEIILGVITSIVLVTIIYIILKYNELVYWRIVVDEMWGRIEIVLKKRYDLIPNLVEVAKEYSKHEKDTFLEVTKARNSWENAKDTNEKAKSAGEVEENLIKLQAVFEKYPNLKANKQFSQLMHSLVKTENDLRKQRMDYNHYVKRYNIRVLQFPRNLVAKIFGFKEKEFFSKEM